MLNRHCEATTELTKATRIKLKTGLLRLRYAMTRGAAHNNEGG